MRRGLYFGHLCMLEPWDSGCIHRLTIFRFVVMTSTTLDSGDALAFLRCVSKGLLLLNYCCFLSAVDLWLDFILSRTNPLLALDPHRQ